MVKLSLGACRWQSRRKVAVHATQAQLIGRAGGMSASEFRRVAKTPGCKSALPIVRAMATPEAAHVLANVSPRRAPRCTHA